MKLELLNAIILKSKSKKDGFYVHRGSAYRVDKGKLTHVTDGNSILEPHGIFVIEVGKVKNWQSDYAKQELKKLLPLSKT